MELGVRNERAEDRRLESGQVEDGCEEEERELKPWEQHTAIIAIPRYDYKAPSSLLERPHSGFLITCPFKREKSATKEAIPILDEHMGFVCTIDSQSSEPCSINAVTKRKRTCSQDDDNLYIIKKNKDGSLLEDSCEGTKVTSLHPAADEKAVKSPNLSLVKLTRSGLLLFTLPNLSYHRVVDTLSSIFRSLDSGTLKPPIWCHRIFPIQGICCLTENDLQSLVTLLVQRYFTSHQNKSEKSIKFAVGYNRRGIEETEMKKRKCDLALPLLERGKCFTVVAGAFKNVIENSHVDLKSPEVAVLVELLPISGLPPGSLMAGVSVLPCELVTAKPRLCIKPLVLNAKETKKKKKKD